MKRDELKYTLGQGEALKLQVIFLPAASAGAVREGDTLCIGVPPLESVEQDLTVDLVGEGASLDLSGLSLCTGSSSVVLRVTVNHHSGGCTSRQLFKCISSDSASFLFDGRILVDPGAQKTKAFQENHNILLSPTATAETHPQLEIYADDVECSHGATVGALDAEEQYYMRSRGIPEKEARTLQIFSFLSPVLSQVADGRLRGTLKRRISSIIRGL